MKISILCTSPVHPVNLWLKSWIEINSKAHSVELFRTVSDLQNGDLLFLISCSEIVRKNIRDKFSRTLVIHASDLPVGRGWSPHIWELLNGKTEVVVSLLEAEDKVDTGRIWKKLKITIPDTALYQDINQILFNAELELMDFAVACFETVKPVAQDSHIQATYLPKRRPEDSQLDVTKSIEDQFDLIRVCDPDRFPAFFYFRGQKYFVHLSRGEMP